MFNISTLLENEKLSPEIYEEISRTLYYSTGISVTVLDDTNQVVYTYGDNTSLIDNFSDVFNGINNHIYKTLAESDNGIGIYSSIYEFSFITSVIFSNQKHYGTFLLGPILTQPANERIINEILKRNNLPLSKRSIIENSIKEIPIANNPRIYYLSKIVHDVVYKNHEISKPAADLFLKDEEVESFNPSNEQHNFNYSLERLFLSKVASGDLESVQTIFNEQVKTLYFTNLGVDHLRSIKNTAIMLCTLLSRSAIKGGVEPDVSLKLSVFYSRKIEDIYRYSELITTIEKMCVDFTEQVLQTSEVNHVSVVKKVSKYIHAHLSEPVRLNDVAKFVDLSPNYFSSLFKREMGIAFADYVNEIRIKESQFLLETTDYPIVDIAVAVGFNNQNYFTTIFRKHTGTTPKQFRMKTLVKS